MKQLLAIPVLLVGFQIASFGDVVAPGTSFEVRTEGPVTVSKYDRGHIYVGHIDRDVYARDGDVAIPRGSRVEMIVREVGDNQMALDLESITVNNRRYAVDTTGPSFNMNRGDYDRGAGLVGNIVGAIAGVETSGAQIRVPDGSVLHFRLQQPMHVVGWQDPGYDRDGNHYHRDHDWYR